MHCNFSSQLHNDGIYNIYLPSYYVFCQYITCVWEDNMVAMQKPYCNGFYLETIYNFYCIVEFKKIGHRNINTGKQYLLKPLQTN